MEEPDQEPIKDVEEPADKKDETIPESPPKDQAQPGNTHPAEEPTQNNEQSAIQEKSLNNANTSKIQNHHNSSLRTEQKDDSHDRQDLPFKISKDVVDLASAIPIVEYVLGKIWTRFEAKHYIDYEILPKENDHCITEILKYAPYLLEKYELIHDMGELDLPEDDEFHQWEAGDVETLPPKVDSHASDTAEIQKIPVFAQPESSNLSDINEGESQNKSKNRIQKITYLNSSAIDEINKSGKSIGKYPKSQKGFEVKSQTSRKTSISKLKLKAFNHLTVTKNTIQEI